MRRWQGFLALGFLFSAIPAVGQPTETSAARIYFPQLVAGGPTSGRWQSTLTFANFESSAVSVTLNFIGDTGSALGLDFGNGPQTQLAFSVPAYGTRTFQTSGSATVVTGWVWGNASSSVQAVLTYRLLQNGVAASEISVPATLPTPLYFSAANPFLGIAVANIYNDVSINVQVTARGNDGQVFQGQIVVPMFGHRSFLLREAISNLPANFSGIVDVRANTSNYYFVAVTLKSDTGAVYSSLPSGALARPVFQYDRIVNVFARIREAARSSVPSVDTVQLNVSSDATVNASANANNIQVNLALAELIADSESELGFAIGHEMGHVYQRRTGKFEFYSNPEFDADVWGLIISLTAGYDPYAGAGTLAKLSMATGQAGLVTQIIDQLSISDAHKSFNTRLDAIYDTIRLMCGAPSLAAMCASYHQTYHPHIPGSSLLATVPD